MEQISVAWGPTRPNSRELGTAWGKDFFAKKGPRLWAMYCHSLILLITCHSGQVEERGERRGVMCSIYPEG